MECVFSAPGSNPRDSTMFLQLQVGRYPWPKENDANLFGSVAVSEEKRYHRAAVVFEKTYSSRVYSLTEAAVLRGMARVVLHSGVQSCTMNSN